MLETTHYLVFNHEQMKDMGLTDKEKKERKQADRIQYLIKLEKKGVGGGEQLFIILT